MKSSFVDREAAFERNYVMKPFQRAMSPYLDVPCMILSQVCSGDGLSVIFATLYWCISKEACIEGIWLVPISEIINGAIKWQTRIGRPYWVDRGVLAKASSHEYSFPSSHSQIVWALATFYQAKYGGGLQLGVFAASVSLSRVYEGLHYPRDIVVGGIIGRILAQIHLYMHPLAKAWLQGQQGFFKRWCALQTLTLLFGGLVFVSYRRVRGKTDPPEWRGVAEYNRKGKQTDIRTAEVPLLSYMGMAVIQLIACWAGVLAGLGTSLAFGIDKGSLNFVNLPTTKAALIARFFLGQVTLLGTFFGIRALTPASPLGLNMTLRFLRYHSVPCHILLVAPAMFRALGI